MKARTTISDGVSTADELHVDYSAAHAEMVFIHANCGNFSFCAGLNAYQARVMSEALLKAAFAIEAAQPTVADKS